MYLVNTLALVSDQCSSCPLRPCYDCLVAGLGEPDKTSHISKTVAVYRQVWLAYLNGVELDFSRPGKPTDNAFIEAFTDRFRQWCPNENWFLTLDDAEERVETRRRQYNGERPHCALNNLSLR